MSAEQGNRGESLGERRAREFAREKKQASERARITALIDDTLDDGDWQRMFRRLARSKSVHAVELLQYCFGERG